MLDLISLLDYSSVSSMCDDLAPILRLVGIVLKGIQIVVPILLIVMGGLDFAKAVTEKDEGKMKDAQKKFMNRAIYAALVFFVTTAVSFVMTLVSAADYKECMPCIKKPFGEECKALMESANDL